MEARIYTPFGSPQPGFVGHLQYDEDDYTTWQVKKYLGIYWVRLNKNLDWQTAFGLQGRGYKVVIVA